jgi:acetyltransferase-like isoleucine patch superfamily enzyme
MGRKFKIIRSIPKTIYFNLRYLPFKQAIKLPVWVASNVRIKQLNRKAIRITGICKLGLVRIGYHEADGLDSYSLHTIIDIENGGKLLINSDAHIGHGANITIRKEGKLSIGANFAISGTTSIICNKSITIGNDVQLSWNSTVMDSDAHKIYGDDGEWINPPKDVVIGNKVWIAANCTISKGTRICDNTVVASNSLVNKPFTEGDCIIGGTPAKALKHISHFEI